MKNTIYTKKSDLDQFYTSENIAKDCYNKYKAYALNKEITLLFEPSAGSGSFFNLFPQNKRLGIDLEPKTNEIKKQDFFDFVPPKNKIIATIGNPPFGKNASLAIKFFNKAAEFSKIIAFIVPKSFQKKSIQDKLNVNYHLKLDVDLPKNSFILNGEEYSVPCCFQIWERSKNKRNIQKILLDNDYFEFVKKDDADFAVRRVGGRTGKAMEDISNCAEVSHYFLRLKNNNSVKNIVNIINNIDFAKIINATAGVKSLSKPEFVCAFLESVKK
jgi:hypothetical protein